MPTIRIHKESEYLPHFITLTTIEWLDIFTKPEYMQIFIESLRFCQRHKRLQVYEYVILTNHIHLLVCAAGDTPLSQIVSDIKKHTTIEIWKLLEKDNRAYIRNILSTSIRKKQGYYKQIWQRENYPIPVISETVLATKVQYIHQNPVKKEYVDHPEDWRYSSARNRMLGKQEILALDNY